MDPVSIIDISVEPEGGRFRVMAEGRRRRGAHAITYASVMYREREGLVMGFNG